MNVEIFALCDAATDYGGKLCLLGTFDCLHARQFPVVHPHCAVALRIRFDRIEEGAHPVRLRLVDEDGKAMGPSVDGTIAMRIPPETLSLCANLVLSINGMKFEKPGRYSMDLAIDHRHEKSLPLTVLRVDPSVAPPASN